LPTGAHAPSSNGHGQQPQQAVDPATGAPRPWPGTGPDAGQVAESVCYVCELAGTPGKFDPKCAAALGVPKGPVSQSSGESCFWVFGGLEGVPQSVR
jgi:hypothetical protein